jgi:hypothetical protein
MTVCPTPLSTELNTPLCAVQVWVLNTTDDLLKHPEQVTWTVCTMTANFAICFLGWWRCFANNYLHWAAGTTWLLLIAQGTVALLSICFILSLSFCFLFPVSSFLCFPSPSSQSFSALSLFFPSLCLFLLFDSTLLFSSLICSFSGFFLRYALFPFLCVSLLCIHVCFFMSSLLSPCIHMLICFPHSLLLFPIFSFIFVPILRPVSAALLLSNPSACKTNIF